MITNPAPARGYAEIQSFRPREIPQVTSRFHALQMREAILSQPFAPEIDGIINAKSYS